MANQGSRGCTAFVCVIGLLILGAVFDSRVAVAATCFATDADGIYDRDGTVDGTITITTASATDVAPADTPYDCTAFDFVVQTGGQLVLKGDSATGRIAALELGDLVIESGGVIRADGEGCQPIANDKGTAPDANNACVGGASGTGGNGTDGVGAGGGGHGGAGGKGAAGAAGLPYGSATLPERFGATGGRSLGSGGGNGGAGGGVISISAEAFIHDGLISANGLVGGGNDFRASGGGAGGSIFLSATSFAGTTGIFVARGGNALGTAGGGGGGRVAVVYDTATFAFDAADFDVSGGGDTEAGAKGTVYVRDAGANTVRVFHGFTFDATDHQHDAWIADDSASNQYCDLALPADATPSLTAKTIEIGGAIDCAVTVASLSIVQTGPGGALTLNDGATVRANGALRVGAATAFAVGAGVTLANTRRATDLTLVMPDGDDQLWSGVTVDGAREGHVLIDAGVALSLTSGTVVKGNPQWPNLTSLTIDATSSIHADGKGCQGIVGGLAGPFPGTAPDASNVCVSGAPGTGGSGTDFNGAGGGGHGGTGAAGARGSGGLPYDSATEPARFGASGGGTGGSGGATGGGGGGRISINAGTFTHDGVISANGADGSGADIRSSGGGAGGSISISAGACNGTTGRFEALGGGAPTNAGGGAGGRVAIVCDTSTVGFDAADFDLAGGKSAGATATGTAYVREGSPSTVRIFHGFTFDDTDHDVGTWIADDSAVNQYCDLSLTTAATPSITAESVVLGGSIECSTQVTSFDVVQTGPGGSLALTDGATLRVNGALTLDAATGLDVGSGATIANTQRGTDLTFTIPDGDDQAWQGVTIDGAPEGRVLLDAGIALQLLDGTTAKGNLSWPHLTALTIDATSALEADGKGCVGAVGATASGAGRAPDCSNVCQQGAKGAGAAGTDFRGSGGGAHGGVGGDGAGGIGGQRYDYATNPRVFGASAGNTAAAGGGPGGTGGGRIDIVVAGTLHNDGAVRARGGAGAGSGIRTTGGGGGGSIKIVAADYACSTGGTFDAAGGDANPAGSSGGGGGGRIVVAAPNDSCSAAPLSSLTAAVAAAGGTGGPGGQDGGAGTVSLTGAAPSCSDPLALVATTGRSASPRTVSAGDALFILRTAVGSECCDLCVCDVNGSRDIAATDALLALKRAVGQTITLACPPCS
jgi:hypothetical protein